MASKVGDGSTFRVEIPPAVDSTSTVEDRAKSILCTDELPPDTAIVNLRTLVLDENVTGARIICEAVSSVGITATPYSNSIDLKGHIASATASNQSYDLLIADYRTLRNRDGDGFAVLAPTSPDNSNNSMGIVPAIILANAADLLSARRATAGKRVHIILKPVTPMSITRAISAIYHNTSGTIDTSIRVASSSTPLPVCTIPVKVLVVEDNVVNQKLIKTLIERGGHQVVMVDNGREAIRVLEENGHFSPNL